MDEKIKGTAEKEVGESTAESKNTEIMIPKERFDEVNARMKSFERELLAKEKALKDLQTSRMVEKEEYKELYEKATSEISELKPKAEQIESWRQVMEVLLEAQINEIPEEMRGLIPEEMSVAQKLNWIAKNKALLIKRTAPDIGAGQRGMSSSGSKVVLSEEQRQIARRFGYTDDEYIKYMG